jgi:hypothetical protein
LILGDKHLIFLVVLSHLWGGGADQQRAFDDIKRYLSSPPVIKATMAGIPLWLYVTVEDVRIRAILMQVTEGLEQIITYLS